MPAGQLHRFQGLAHRGQDLGIDPAAVFKAHLGLGRVDVDIHLFGRGRKMHDKDRVPPPGQQPLVSLAHGPGHELVADDAAVDQEELILGGGNVVVRAGNQTRDPEAVARQIQGQHLFGPLRPQEDRQPFPEAGVGGGLEQGLVLGLDQEVDLGVAQGQVAQQLQNLPLFRRLAAQEFAPGRGVVEQVGDGDPGPGGPGPGEVFLDHTPGHRQTAAELELGAAGADLQPGDGGDGREGLTPEPHGLEAEQIAIVLEFTGGMPEQAQGGFFGPHAAAVIAHPDQSAAAFGDLDVDGAGARVQGVFHQLFDDRGRAGDDFAGRNLAGHFRG